MQFIGRVMRVARPVRDAFGKPVEIPADLNTAYVYLGNAQAQAGFEAAVKASTEVKSQLEGQTEKLLTRQTVSGAVVYTNRPTEQEPVAFDMPMPDNPEIVGMPLAAPAATALGAQGSLFHGAGSAGANAASDSTWDDPVGVLDVVVASPSAAPRARRKELTSRDELLSELDSHGPRVYPRKHNLPKLERSLKTEEKPELDDMSEISRAVATRLQISEGLGAMAVKAALNRIKEQERHIELTTGEGYTEEIQVFTDRSGLAREAMAALRELPQAEEEDYRIIVQVLASRLRGAINDEIENMPEDAQPPEVERTRLAPLSTPSAIPRPQP